MPRGPRRKSISGYYHVIVRGVGKQILFENDGDRYFFLKKLEQYSVETGTVICAYCIMENHVHLLIYDGQKNLSVMMKKIEVSYSEYFNKKYDRTGHLFQDRYLSEPVETEQYLLTVFRYILRNPETAGICKTESYQWSSYALYGKMDTLVDTSELCKRIGDEKNYRCFIAAGQSEECMDCEPMEFEPRRHDDTWAMNIIRDRFHVSTGTALQTFQKEQRNEAIAFLISQGVSQKQIERLTGISRGVIQYALGIT